MTRHYDINKILTNNYVSIYLRDKKIFFIDKVYFKMLILKELYVIFSIFFIYYDKLCFTYGILYANKRATKLYNISHL